ncbi:MAG: hypothetical protein M3R50_03530 [Bacteroidota bacterium]|nr:hypothetical protein [Bacteroidota bacterium]
MELLVTNKADNKTNYLSGNSTDSAYMNILNNLFTGILITPNRFSKLVKADLKA